ncbi:MAG TPA: TIGR03435 family protein [Terracidiphilus sp.]|nr:TIGR03435 family protein [Terracidiphilus sp.]
MSTEVRANKTRRPSYTGPVMSFCRSVAGLFAFAILIASATAQQAATPAATTPSATPARLPAFEVAAIKLSRPDDNHHGWHGTADRISIENYTLQRLIRSAYGLKSDLQVIGGPDWIGKQAFDIQAKIDEADVEKMHKMSAEDRQKARSEMLQSLLADRFQLKVRLDHRTMPVYALVQTRGGAKLTPSATGGKNHGSSTDNGHMVATALSMDAFADDLTYLSETGDRVVLNRTGLTGEYDFKMNWTEDPGTGVPPDSEFPGLFTALQEQLGLKLESQKGSVPVVIVDAATRPAID